MNLRICDTNVFYDVSNGIIDKVELQKDMNSLGITPVSILELASKVDQSNFAERSGAAKVALEMNAIIVEGPEYYLTKIWNLHADSPNINWNQILEIISVARDVNELQNGVSDWKNRVILKLDTNLATYWRTFQYADFVSDMIDAVDSYVPGYAKTRSKGQMKQASASTRKNIRKVVSAIEAKMAILLATRERALLAIDPKNQSPPNVTPDDLMAAIPPLLPYLMTYSRYFELCSTKFAPQENDWGDLECFLYMGGGNQIATADQRWIDICKDIGFSHLIYDTNRIKI